MKDDRTFKVNFLAKELGVSIQTIKNYEKQGLLPTARRDSKGWRYYKWEDIVKIKALFQEELVKNHTGRDSYDNSGH